MSSSAACLLLSSLRQAPSQIRWMISPVGARSSCSWLAMTLSLMVLFCPCPVSVPMHLSCSALSLSNTLLRHTRHLSWSAHPHAFIRTCGYWRLAIADRNPPLCCRVQFASLSFVFKTLQIGSISGPRPDPAAARDGHTFSTRFHLQRWTEAWQCCRMTAGGSRTKFSGTSKSVMIIVELSTFQPSLRHVSKKGAPGP